MSLHSLLRHVLLFVFGVTLRVLAHVFAPYKLEQLQDGAVDEVVPP